METRPASRGDAWRSSVFGVPLLLDRGVEGLRPSGAAVEPPTVVRTGGSPASAPPGGCEELASVPPPAVRAGALPVISIRRADGDYHVWSAGGGEFVVAGDGLAVACRIEGVPDEEWQPVLLGQVLPLVAVLRGREVLHASGVAVGDRAVALVGPSGIGKSTLGAELVARGGTLISDDALALQQAQGGVVAHPGPAHARLGTRQATGLKPRLPRDTVTAPVLITDVVFLERARAGDAPTVVAEPDPRRFLANAFVVYVKTPARLIAQLSLYAALARSARVRRAVLPYSEQAESLLSHLDVVGVP